MIFLLIACVLAAVFVPQMWARSVLDRYGRERPDIPGTGAELALHLLKSGKLEGYSVVTAEPGTGDHFNPATRTVALTDTHHSRRSLTAAVVAAHEVGHAIQDYIGYPPLRLRTRLAATAAWAERLASVILVAMPLITVLTRTPAAGAALLIAGIATMGLPVIIHLITLPVEFDASFRRALPILEHGYLDEKDLDAARRILLACALTYVAASLASLLNFWRWIRILRR